MCYMTPKGQKQRNFLMFEKRIVLKLSYEQSSNIRIVLLHKNVRNKLQ